jgi:hypothetical protein
VAALSLPVIGFGVIYSYWLAGVGVVMLLGAVYGWGLEPSVDPGSAHGDHHEPEPGPEPADETAVAASAEGDGAGATDADAEAEAEPVPAGAGDGEVQA